MNDKPFAPGRLTLAVPDSLAGRLDSGSPSRFAKRAKVVATSRAARGFPPSVRAHRSTRLEKVLKIFPKLRERQGQIAGTLSGGEQQMVAIGRGLMAGPKILMLDEPSLGLAPLLVEEMFRVVEEINRQGVTVLLVEQNTEHALRIASRGFVLESGRVVLSGTGLELLSNQRVREAYLGL
jgi:branched-chain amino acid transport system ATP-binding protein